MKTVFCIVVPILFVVIKRVVHFYEIFLHKFLCKMKSIIIITIFILFIPPCFSQQDLLPAHPREIRGEGTTGNIAYFIPENRPFTGIVFDEKTKNRLGEYSNGYRNGMFTEYFTNGKKKSEGKYIYGAKDGTHTEWYENGNIKKSESKYFNDKKEGEEIYYHSNGKLKVTYKYSDGKIIIGTYPVYNDLGVVEKEEHYPSEVLKQQALPVSPFLIDTTYSNGDRYVGYMKDSKKNGQGRMRYNSQGLIYSGEWKNDKKDGYGTNTWDDGSINYQGEFKNGVPDGKGTTYNKGKKQYEGEWKNGKKNGKGLYTYEDAEGNTVSYTGGYFVNDEFEGQGTCTMKTINGTTTFTGEFKSGDYFNGILYLTTADGIKRAIEYKNGKKGMRKIIK